MIVTDERVARFVSDRLGFALCPPYTCAGIERDGEIVAGCLFNCFQPPDIRVTAAGTGWTRGFLEAVGRYVFGQLGCIRATFITEQPRVVALAERLGGVVEGRMRDHFGEGRDGIVIGLLRKSYRYASFSKE